MDIEYDPKFPYLVVDEYVIAKFPAGDRGYGDAQSVAEGYGWEFIDTTPKPKIPEDAEYVYWRDGDDQPYFARRGSSGYWETDEGVIYSSADLLGNIGDAEVTVLVPKEGS